MTIKDWHNNYIREGKTYNEKREVGKKQWGGKITKPDFFVYDNFYNNPMHMRAWALSLDFKVTGNYPGLITASIRSITVYMVLYTIIEV